MKKKKVLIAAPIGGKKQYSMGLWLNWIANQNYKHYDICLCVNGEYRSELFKKIRQSSIIDKHGQVKNIISRIMHNSHKTTVIQNITYSREIIRRYAIRNDYDAIFWLDTDTIPASKDAIIQLLRCNKDSVSGLYFYKESKVPVIIDQDTNTNITMQKIEQAVEGYKCIEIWGSGYGCVMHQGQALQIPFDYSLFEENYTDDFGHCHALEQVGIKRWFYPLVLCKHFGESEPIKKINDIISAEINE